MTSRRNGERQRLHNHYLKSTIVCGHCGSRLLVQNTTARGGDVYRYFVCARRHRLHTCDFSAVLIDEVEQRVADLYHSIALTPEDRQQIARYLQAELGRIQANSHKDIRALRIRRSQLETERRSLLQAQYAGAIPLELLTEEQNRLARQLAELDRTLTGYAADTALVQRHLDQALDLMEDCHRLYTAAPDHLKKLLNQVFFSRVLVNPKRDEQGRIIVPPDALITRAAEKENQGTGAAIETGIATEQRVPDGARAAEVAMNTEENQAVDATIETGIAAEQTALNGARAAGRTGAAMAMATENQVAGVARTMETAGTVGTAADAALDAPTDPDITVEDPASRTSAAAFLIPPFNQLASPALHAAASAAQRAGTAGRPPRSNQKSPPRRMDKKIKIPRKNLSPRRAQVRIRSLWWTRPDSNRRPTRCKRVALPTELQVQVQWLSGARCPSSQCLHTKLTARAASAGDFTVSAGRATNHLRHGERRMSRGHRGRLSALGWRP